MHSPVLPPLLLQAPQTPETSGLMACGLNAQALASYWLNLYERFLIRYFLQCWTFSWGWRGGTVHKKAGLHSLQRLCADVAPKGQSGWQLCDHNDSKYVPSTRHSITSPHLTLGGVWHQFSQSACFQPSLQLLWTTARLWARYVTQVGPKTLWTAPQSTRTTVGSWSGSWRRRSAGFKGCWKKPVRFGETWKMRVCSWLLAAFYSPSLLHQIPHQRSSSSVQAELHHNRKAGLLSSAFGK